MNTVNTPQTQKVIGRYFGKRPWFKSGYDVKGALTAREAIDAARLNWDVELAPLHADYAGGSVGVVGHRAVIRGDTRGVLGIVGDKYKPLQNRDAFTFMDAIIGTKDAVYTAGGAMGGGRRVWLLARLPGDIRVAGTDVVEPYILLSNSHDGSSTLQISMATIRVVCANTLTQVLQMPGRIARLRHVGEIGLKIQAVRDVLGMAINWRSQFETQTSFLVSRQFTEQRLAQFITNIGMGVDVQADESVQERQRQRVEDIRVLAIQGRGNAEAGIKGTWWAALNGVTEYVDYHRSRGRGDNAEDSRIRSTVFGSGAAIKQRALTAALQFAGN